MENKMDKRINNIGKAGRIISTIIAVFMILAAIATAIGIGVTATLPKDALKIEITGTADVTSKGKIIESIGNAILDSSEGGDGKIYISGDEENPKVAVGDVKDSVPEGVAVEKTDKGIKLDVNSKELNLNVDVVLAALISALINTICAIVILFMVRALMKSLEKCDTPFCDDVIKKMKRFGYSLIPFAVLSGISENSWHYVFSPGLDVHLGVDLTVVCGILVVFMLVMIFSYGAELQKQSDETL